MAHSNPVINSSTPDSESAKLSASKGAQVTIQKMHHRYHATGQWVLEDINLSISPGGFVGLLGPSGCGKSTMLKLISGLASPNQGKVAVNGSPPVEARDKLAFVFQDATLLPWLSVRKNVEIPLRLRGVDPETRKETADRLLELVRLSHVADEHPRQLSGGMKMRTSIARALSLKPELMLLDEPFGALDEMTRDKLNDNLLEIRAAAAWTAFFVTHSVSEAVFLSNQIAVFSANPGRIHSLIEVDFPYPRTPELRDSIEFHNQVCEVSKILRIAQQG